jgi:hypothetical protein
MTVLKPGQYYIVQDTKFLFLSNRNMIKIESVNERNIYYSYPGLNIGLSGLVEPFIYSKGRDEIKDIVIREATKEEVGIHLLTFL